MIGSRFDSWQHAMGLISLMISLYIHQNCSALTSKRRKKEIVNEKEEDLKCEKSRMPLRMTGRVKFNEIFIRDLRFCAHMRSSYSQEKQE